MKQTPKSCGCRQCRYSKGTRGVNKMMKHEERAFRHNSKIAVNKGVEDITPAHNGARYG